MLYVVAQDDEVDRGTGRENFRPSRASLCERDRCRGRTSPVTVYGGSVRVARVATTGIAVHTERT
jgi:hypothetical protein